MSRNQHQDNTIEVVNTGSSRMSFVLDAANITLKPGERCRILKVHANPRVMQPGRDPVASTIQMLTNGKVVPITHKDARPFLTEKELAAVKKSEAQRKALADAARDPLEQLEQGEV